MRNVANSRDGRGEMDAYCASLALLCSPMDVIRPGVALAVCHVFEDLGDMPGLSQTPVLARHIDHFGAGRSTHLFRVGRRFYHGE